MERVGEAGSYRAGRVLGEGTATFTASETGAGSVEVEIQVNADVTEPVPAAVAFEYLTSKEVDAAGEESEGETVNDIAKHDDIKDDAQTVVSKETPKTSEQPTTQAPKTEKTSPAVPLVPTTVTTTVKQGFNPNPEIRTVAEFKDGVNVVQNGNTVVDTVYYYGLVAGKSYTCLLYTSDAADE